MMRSLKGRSWESLLKGEQDHEHGQPYYHDSDIGIGMGRSFVFYECGFFQRAQEGSN